MGTDIHTVRPLRIFEETRRNTEHRDLQTVALNAS